MHTLGPRIWQEALKNLENEICTLQDLEYDEKPDRKKTRKAQCRTWSMARNTERHGKRQMLTVGPGIWQEI